MKKQEFFTNGKVYWENSCVVFPFQKGILKKNLALVDVSWPEPINICVRIFPEYQLKKFLGYPKFRLNFNWWFFIELLIENENIVERKRHLRLFLKVITEDNTLSYSYVCKTKQQFNGRLSLEKASTTITLLLT